MTGRESPRAGDWLFLIWSIEHGAWWRPGRWGYTYVLAEAGRYSAREAAAIVEDANVVTVNECRIPVACVSPSKGEP